MKEEIKEILDYLGNDKNYNCDCNDGSYYLELPYREAHELKDCITNLQEENERLKQPQIFIDTMDMEERYGQELYEDYLKEQLEDYKQRNEKAIEILKLCNSKCAKETINILKGDKDE